MASKYLIGLIAGFVLAGGATLYSYGEDFGVRLTETLGISDSASIEKDEAATIEKVSLYKDCSVYDFTELTLDQRRGFSEEQVQDYFKEKQESFENKMNCGRYNNEIATAENDKRILDEKKEISRGF